MYRVTREARATGLHEETFETLEEAKKYLDEFYGVGWFDFKVYRDDKLIGENIFGLGWNWLEEEL